MTHFEKAVQEYKAGKLKTPNVMMEGKQLDPFKFQLANHRFAFRILMSGMKMKNVRLKDLKEYYGLKGRTAKDCFPQFDAIYASYR